MSSEKIWNDAARADLRESITSAILGEIRLAKNDHETILQSCREIYIDDDVPDDENAAFIQFAADEFDRIFAQHLIERETWPDETDCDRLDRVEATLRGRGIVLWQASPCCDTCTGAELPDRIEVIEGRFPGFTESLRGYAFFIEQNMPEGLADNTEYSPYMAYGWYSPDGNDVTPEEYEPHALDIAREVSRCLRDEGFEVDWNGSFSKKIGISLNWQRRTLLE